MTDSNITALVDSAIKAGRAAAEAIEPMPMVVTDASRGKSYFVSEGPCGFAWINVKPANCAVAKYLKAHYRASRDSYNGGITYWVHDYGQSMARKEAFAYAMAKVLRDAGIRAYAGSRMD